MARFFDTGIFSVNATDGSVGVGYKLYFYSTGTTSPKDTYPTKADALAGTNANANPVLSSASGRFPPVWMVGGDYKAILTIATGSPASPLETRDPAGINTDALPNDTLAGTFWNPSANIKRVGDRVFMGAAVTNGGGASSNEDWYGQLATNPDFTYNGVQAASGNDLIYAQAASLADPSASIAAGAYPQIGFLAAIMSKNGITGSTPRALEAIAFNNCSTTGQFTPIWAIYAEAHRDTANTLNTYAAEFATFNLVSSVVWNSYAQTGAGTVGLLLQSGAGRPATGQFNGTVALEIQDNGKPWNLGIMFHPNAIAATGLSSSMPAVQMAEGQAVQWLFDATHISAQFRTSGGNLNLDLPYTGGFYVSGFVSQGASVVKTTSFTLAATENSITCNGSGTITATLPAASSVPGRRVKLRTIAAQTVVSATSNVVPLAGGAAGTAILAGTAGKWAELESDGTNWQIAAAA